MADFQVDHQKHNTNVSSILIKSPYLLYAIDRTQSLIRVYTVCHSPSIFYVHVHTQVVNLLVEEKFNVKGKDCKCISYTVDSRYLEFQGTL